MHLPPVQAPSLGRKNKSRRHGLQRIGYLDRAISCTFPGPWLHPHLLPASDFSALWRPGLWARSLSLWAGIDLDSELGCNVNFHQQMVHLSRCYCLCVSLLGLVQAGCLLREMLDLRRNVGVRREGQRRQRNVSHSSMKAH